MCRAIAAIGLCMLAFVAYLHVAFHKEFADMALGYVAGLVFVGCGLYVHRFTKGEVR